MHGYQWLVWSVVLFLQNFAFTYVSRARSSGSLVRHVKASFFSNGIWIFSQMLMLGPMLDYLTGRHGIGPQVWVGLQYTFTTMAGSIAVHYWALKTEKGKNAVGANKLYAQIPVAEWEEAKAKLLHPLYTYTIDLDPAKLNKTSVSYPPCGGFTGAKLAGE